MGFVARGDDAIQFWTEAVGSLPDDVGPLHPRRPRRRRRCARARCRRTRASRAASTGSSLRLIVRDRGHRASRRTSSRRCLAEGRRYVRLAGRLVRDDRCREGEGGARCARSRSSPPAAGRAAGSRSRRPGRIQELLEQVGKANVTADAKDLFEKLRDIDEIEVVKKPRNLKAQLRPYQEQGFSWL